MREKPLIDKNSYNDHQKNIDGHHSLFHTETIAPEFVTLRGFGQAYFSAEKSHDPASVSHNNFLAVAKKPHVEFARQQTRTQPPPRGFASAKHRSGLTYAKKHSAGSVSLSHVTLRGFEPRFVP
jgi:hypothetical protein